MVHGLPGFLRANVILYREYKPLESTLSDEKLFIQIVFM